MSKLYFFLTNQLEIMIWLYFQQRTSIYSMFVFWFLLSDSPHRLNKRQSTVGTDKSPLTITKTSGPPAKVCYYLTYIHICYTHVSCHVIIVHFNFISIIAFTFFYHFISYFKTQKLPLKIRFLFLNNFVLFFVVYIVNRIDLARVLCFSIVCYILCAVTEWLGFFSRL